jgi:hypothetical protein
VEVARRAFYALEQCAPEAVDRESLRTALQGKGRDEDGGVAGILLAAQRAWNAARDKCPSLDTDAALEAVMSKLETE